MRMRYVSALFLLFSATFGPANPAQGQQATSDGARRIVRQTPPTYPELAKKMNLGGTVKVVAAVMANGDVKSVAPVGGSPILIKAAEDAVSKWKFAPGGESREIIELHFTPNE